MSEDWDIYEILSFLKDIREDKIVFTGHVKEKIEDRGISYDTIVNSILNETPLAISKQNFSKFKVKYPFKNNESRYDLVVVVAVEHVTKSLKVITTYKENVKKRVR
ncbi:hypothetical protein [Methanobacterium aggregans]|uniref:hypothetical protein n=1 Tax=Methanobacterium aggregans TaxID=1615586 RepID=UPI001AE94548|nr:hypothetical protein [Methanobacterium aggregans]MBP2047051.1 hypothetical protein [Methanobacterium aggregans]